MTPLILAALVYSNRSRWSWRSFISFYLPSFAKWAKHEVPGPASIGTLSHFRVVDDNGNDIIVPLRTNASSPMIVTDELDADWCKVKLETALVAPVYNHPGFGMQGCVKDIIA